MIIVYAFVKTWGGEESILRNSAAESVRKGGESRGREHGKMATRVVRDVRESSCPKNLENLK